MNNAKIFIGPMSKNIVDCLINFSNNENVKIGIIASRRQIENFGGYVNNWKTNEFVDYIRKRSNNILIQRDHAGPEQGQFSDDGYDSLSSDSMLFDLIHIDPWKKFSDYDAGLDETINMINFCYNLNNKLEFEIGTEEAIRPYDSNELDNLINDLKNKLKPAIFEKIKYAVIQSGTSLKETHQTGIYNSDRLESMLAVCKKFEMLSKEHNGDYLPINLIKDKFNKGLDSINIAPEFGVIETNSYIEEISDTKTINDWWQICFDSNKWQKWVTPSFNPYENKLELIRICGHYTFSNDMFNEKIKSKYKNIDEIIHRNIFNKLKELYEL